MDCVLVMPAVADTEIAAQRHQEITATRREQNRALNDRRAMNFLNDDIQLLCGRVTAAFTGGSQVRIVMLRREYRFVRTFDAELIELLNSSQQVGDCAPWNRPVG